jgi:hypothetical protein
VILIVCMTHRAWVLLSECRWGSAVPEFYNTVEELGGVSVAAPPSESPSRRLSVRTLGARHALPSLPPRRRTKPTTATARTDATARSAAPRPAARPAAPAAASANPSGTAPQHAPAAPINITPPNVQPPQLRDRPRTAHRRAFPSSGFGAPSAWLS